MSFQAAMLCLIIQTTSQHPINLTADVVDWLDVENLPSLVPHFHATGLSLETLMDILEEDELLFINYLLCLGLPRDAIFMMADRLRRTKDHSILNRLFFPDKVGSKFMIVPTNESHNDGIVNFLGTNFNTEPWRNPVTRGLITVYTSGRRSRSDNMDHLVDRFPDGPFPRPMENGWVSFDFGEKLKIKPIAYTLRQSQQESDAFFLRNWLFEGGHGGEEWVVIKEHSDDTTLRQCGQSHTWMLFGLAEHVSFRRFRIRMTGPDSSGRSWHIKCSCFEIFGYLTGKK